MITPRGAGARGRGWRMVGTDIDATSLQHAAAMLHTNAMCGDVKLVLVASGEAASSATAGGAAVAEMPTDGGASAAAAPSDAMASGAVACHAFHRVEDGSVLAGAVVYAEAAFPVAAPTAAAALASTAGSASGESATHDAAAVQLSSCSAAEATAVSSYLRSTELPPTASSTAGAASSSAADSVAATASSLAPFPRYGFGTPPAVTFTLCNPPFFSSWAEAEASMKGHAASTCTGSYNEMVSAGV